jgi:hypothetical protein
MRTSLPSARSVAFLLALAASLAAGTRAHSQTLGINVGDSARLVVAPGARVAIPLRIDLASAGAALNLASLQGTFSWGTARLAFDSVRTANADFTVTSNTTGAATGSILASAFSTARLAASGPLLTLHFTASATTGGTRLLFAPTDAGAEDGTRVLTALRVRALDVCVAPSGRWGDVNDDGSVSIIDAQQVARHSVALSVANTAAMATRGDVTADGTVSIIDAQQIARFSVALSAAARINTPLFTLPTAASVALAPAGAQTLAVGVTLALSPTVRDAANADITGCAPVVWGSTAPGVATVSPSGLVTAVAAGTTTITATSGTATATVAVTVTGGTATTGITVTATSPVPTSRFYVRIDSGGLSAEINRRFATTSRTLNQVIALPAGSGYRVRVYAVDSASSSPDTVPLVGALGVARNVAVTSGTATAVPVALAAPVVTVSMPDTVTVAQRAVATVSVRYPVRAFPGENSADLYCNLRWGTTPITDVAWQSGWWFTTPAASDTTATCQPQIPAQGVTGTLHHQVALLLRAFTVDSGSTVQPRVIVPSTQRGQAPRQLQVRPMTTGAVVSFTSPVSARRVYAIAMGGALGTPPVRDSATVSRLLTLLGEDVRRNPPTTVDASKDAGKDVGGTAVTRPSGDADAVATDDRRAPVVGVGEVVVRLDGNGLRSGSLTVPLPAGSGYDIRLVGLDSASWVNDSTNGWAAVLAAAARSTGITVPATGTVPVSMTLVAPTVTAAWPDSVGVGQAIAGSITITDPADLFAGLSTGGASTFYGATAWTRNAAGPARVNVGSSSASPAGSRTWNLTVPGQSTAGILHLQTGVYTLFWQADSYGIFPTGFDRNLARGQALRTIRVGVPAVGTTGITVTATSPVPTSRFYVRIDSGGLTTEINRRFATTSRSLDQVIALPPGSGYRVRVYAVDSASVSPDTVPLVGGLGVVRNVVVNAGAATAVPVALAAPTLAVSMPDTVTTAQRAVATVTMRYPVRAFPGESSAEVYCEVRWGTTPITDLGWQSSWSVTAAANSDTTATCQPQIPAQGAAGVLYHNMAIRLRSFTLDAGGPTVLPRLIVPSTQRGQALRQLQVRPIATGAVVSFTSAVAARRVYAIVMGSALGTPPVRDSAYMARVLARIGEDGRSDPDRTASTDSPGTVRLLRETDRAPVHGEPNPAIGVGEVVVVLNGNGLRSGSLTVPLPPGSGYDIRLVAIDSTSWVNDSTNSRRLVLAGAARTTGITVPSTGTVPVSMSMIAPTVTSVWPDSVGVGQAINMSITITDPADIFSGLSVGGAVGQSSATPWTRNGFGSNQGSAQFTSTASSAGSRTWTVTIPSQTTPGVLYAQTRVYTYLYQPNSEFDFVYVHDPNLARGQALRTIRVVAGGTGTCTTAPIALGDSVSGTLAATDCVSQRITGGYEDRYSITLGASTPVELRLRSAAFDTYLQVRNASGAVVFENDDDATSTNSFLAVTLPAGSYTITAGSWDAGATGAYSLTLRRPPALSSVSYATTSGASIATLEPGASVNTAITVRDTTGATITPTVTYTVRDDSVAAVVTGGIQARSRSGATPGTFVVASVPSLTPVPAESIWVLVPRNGTGPVLRTDLASYRMPTVAGTAVTFNVVMDMRNAAQLGAADFDLVYPTSLFYPVVSGSTSPVVTAAPGVTFLSQSMNSNIGRISFSYGRPGSAGSTNDGVVPIAQVTLYSRGTSASFPSGMLTLIPGSVVSNALADLMPQLTAYGYPLVVRAP